MCIFLITHIFRLQQKETFTHNVHPSPLQLSSYAKFCPRAGIDQEIHSTRRVILQLISKDKKIGVIDYIPPYRLNKNAQFSRHTVPIYCRTLKRLMEKLINHVVFIVTYDKITPIVDMMSISRSINSFENGKVVQEDQRGRHVVKEFRTNHICKGERYQYLYLSCVRPRVFEGY